VNVLEKETLKVLITAVGKISLPRQASYVCCYIAMPVAVFVCVCLCLSERVSTHAYT
jgi:hypothetical protein